VGRLCRFTWRRRLPCDLSFESHTTRSEPPYLIEGTATRELVGVGRWRLYEGRGTALVYEWNVRTSRPCMNRLAPVARPVFAWNRDAVMRQGAEGLARLLDAPLLART
jgi:hypothetical protein